MIILKFTVTNGIVDLHSSEDNGGRFRYSASVTRGVSWKDKTIGEPATSVSPPSCSSLPRLCVEADDYRVKIVSFPVERRLRVKAFIGNFKGK